MKLSRLLFLFSFIFMLIGCGYKPATYYTKQEIDGTVFVNLIVNLEDPRNTVLVKDAMNEILVHRLGTKLIDNPTKADTIINLKLMSVKTRQVQKDAQGYSKVYNATVTINVDYKNATKSGKFQVTGENDFSIDSATVTDTDRFQAIESAASKALEEVVSKFAINSFKK